MKIKTMKLVDLRPSPYNPRKDLRPGDPEYEALKRSMKEFGLVDPLIWNKRTGNLVGGHQRLKVMLAEGVKESEVSVVDLDADREKALNIALNRVAGRWDTGGLKTLLLELDDGDFDLTMTGFSQAELKKMIDWEGVKFPEFGVNAADGIELCTCPTCGHEHHWPKGTKFSKGPKRGK